MKTLADLVEESGIKKEKLLIWYPGSNKNRLIFPMDVKGDPSLEKLLHLGVETMGNMFIVRVPLLFKNLLYDIVSNTVRLKNKLIIYDSTYKPDGVYEISKDASVSFKDVDRFMELEIKEVDGEYTLDVDSQKSS